MLLSVLGSLLGTVEDAVSSHSATDASALESAASQDSASGASFAQTLQQSIHTQRSSSASASQPAQMNPAQQPTQTTQTTQTAATGAQQPGAAAQANAGTQMANGLSGAHHGWNSGAPHGSGRVDPKQVEAASTQAAAAALQAQVQAQMQAQQGQAGQSGQQTQAQATASTDNTIAATAASAAANAANAAAALASAATGANGAAAGEGGTSGDPKSASDALHAAFEALRNGAATMAGQAAATGVAHMNLGNATSDVATRSGAGSFGEHLSAHDTEKNVAASNASNLTNKPVSTAAANAGSAQSAHDNSAAATQLASQQANAGSASQNSEAEALASIQAATSAAAQTQAAAAPAAAASAGANAAGLSSQIGSSDWEDELGQKVVFLSNSQQSSAELTLNPKDLGPLQVVLQVSDTHAHALFVSQHQQVREAVEAALPKLREAMAQNGIGLGSASVTDGFARQMNQNPQQNGGSREARNSGSSGSDDGDVQGSTAVAAASTLTRRTEGLIDTFA